MTENALDGFAIRDEFETLTSRECEILALVARGMSNSQVAARFDVTVHAVKFHLASIYRKLHVANRTEAAARFFQHGAANGAGPAGD